jgi:hypothetical protein
MKGKLNRLEYAYCYFQLSRCPFLQLQKLNYEQDVEDSLPLTKALKNLGSYR